MEPSLGRPITNQKVGFLMGALHSSPSKAKGSKDLENSSDKLLESKGNLVKNLIALNLLVNGRKELGLEPNILRGFGNNFDFSWHIRD